MPGRASAVTIMKSQLLRRASPRLVMSLLISISGGVAFLVAYGLLRTGVVSMAVRYGAAALAGYLLLLVMFRMWLWAAVRRVTNRDSEATTGDSVLDGISDVFLPSTDAPGHLFGGGGGFGGAGGGSSWEGGVDVVAGDAASVDTHVADVGRPGHILAAGHGHDISSGPGSEGGLDLGFDLDVDEAVIIIIPIVAAVGIGIVVASAVWTAPALFAELLLDGLVGAGIYQGLRRSEVHSWLGSAVRHTRWSAAAVIAIAVAAGYLIQHFAPYAVSIGDLWRR
jgi:hypothetical protein